MNEKLLMIIERIKNHELGDEKEAFELYFSLCDCLKEKYGLVDKDYDEKPTMRGKEWIDIHHIMEYEFANIARYTKNAIEAERMKHNPPDGQVVEIFYHGTFKNKELIDKVSKELNEKYPGKVLNLIGVSYTIEDLKPYNAKKQLVYANKIEHFLLHYLIASLKGKDVFCGGVNFLWDSCVALDLYWSKQKFMQHIQDNKATYYSVLSSEEITLLYKKMIDWKNWDIIKCNAYWIIFRYNVRYLYDEEISYFSNKEKLYELLEIIKYNLKEEVKMKIETLPFRVKIVDIIRQPGLQGKIINKDLYSLDEKTIYVFKTMFTKKTFKIPNNIEIIEERAFWFSLYLTQLTIPKSVIKIAENAFIGFNLAKSANNEYSTKVCLKLEKIIYEGTREEWDSKFSNVILRENVKLVFKEK